MIILGFLPQNSMTKAVAVVVSVAQAPARGQDLDVSRRGDLARFRREFYTSLNAHADALFELKNGPTAARVPCWSRSAAPRRIPSPT